MNIQEFIEKYSPCKEAAEWLVTQPDLQTAWENCNRLNWMFWALDRLRPLTEQQNAALSVAIVKDTPLTDGRFVVDLLTDDRSLTFLKMKEEWGSSPEGTSKPERWASARAAAEADIWTAEWGTATTAAWAATCGAATTVSRAAAEAAARAAAMAAAETDTWDATWAAAREAAWAAQVNIIRRFVPTLTVNHA